MTSPTDTRPDLTDGQLSDLAVDFLDAMLSSASVDVIGVAHWWDRAKTALETGVAAADSVRAVTATVARKLQVDTLSVDTATEVARLADILADPDVFARWRRIASRDAVYIAAMTRLRRDARRKPKTSDKPKPTQTVVDELPGF